MNDAVKVLVYDNAGRLLVLRRSDTHPTLPLHPDLPGGDVDQGEALIDAALREIQEETGILLHHTAIHHERTGYSRFGGARVLYSARLDATAPEVTISWEHDRYDWMHVSEFVALEKPPRPDFFLDLARRHLASS